MGSFPAKIAQYFSRGIVSGCAGYAAPGVRSRTAQIKPPDRCAVVGVSQQGARREYLVESQRAVHDVSVGQAEYRLQICRREHLATDDACLEIGRVAVDGVDDEVGGFPAVIRPAPAFGKLRVLENT